MVSEKERSRQLARSISEGNAAAIMEGAGTAFIPAFALRLGASSGYIAVLAALPQLVHALTQFLVLRTARTHPERLRFIVPSVFLQALLWLPMAGLIFLSGEAALAALLALHVAVTALGAFVNPLWTAWISDWVPRERMGRYFGLRNKIIGFTLVSSTFVGGLVLGGFQDAGLALLGFAALFVLAGASRLVSAHFLRTARERRRRVTPLASGSIWPDLSKTPRFMQLVKYSAAYTFCVQLAAPFFVVYLLDDLGVGYPTYAAILTASAFASYLSMPYWGKLADRVGSKRVLGYSALAIPLVPLAYLVPPAPALYYLLVEAFGGMLWAGQKLASFNCTLEYSPALRRPRFVAVHNLAVGLATFGGALVGGALALFFKDIAFFGLHGLLFLFLLSGVLRILAAAYFVPHMPGNHFPHSHRLHTFFRHVTSLPLRSMSFVLQRDVLQTVAFTGKSLTKLERAEHRLMRGLDGRTTHKRKRAAKNR